MNEARILVAGIGNVFFGDDGFGVQVVRRMEPRPGVRVVDFGIRGFDLTCALLESYDLVILVDVVRKGGRPGTLYLLEVEDRPDDAEVLEGHGLVPAHVFRAVRTMGGSLRNVFMVACEPESFGDPETGRMGLSESVEEAIEEAIRMVESLVQRRLAAHA